MEHRPKTRLDDADAAFLRGDFATARDLYDILAATGSKQALLCLAALYERGNTDVPQDFDKARQYYERAFREARSAVAALELGHIYFRGLGVAHDYEKAYFYYSKLEHDSDPIALLRLGILYETGKGVSKNAITACDYYRRAAALGNIPARKNLGVLELRRGNIILGGFLWVWAIAQGVSLAFLNSNDKRMRAY